MENVANHKQKLHPRHSGYDVSGFVARLYVNTEPLTILYALNLVISTHVGKRFLSRKDAIAIVYGSVMRNLSIALAIAMNAFGPQGSSAALVVAMAYIIQVQSAAWYVKFGDSFFGKAPSPARGRQEEAQPSAKPVLAVVGSQTKKQGKSGKN